jgi:hypothetical protein
MESLNYGTLPDRQEFIKKITAEQGEGESFAYVMQLSREDAYFVSQAINQGIDSHLEAVFFGEFEGDHGKMGIEIIGADSLHTLLRRLIEIGEAESDENGNDGAIDFAGSILYTLDYEWV